MSTGIDVLVCNWEETCEKPQCIVQSGFNFDNVVTDKLKVEIPYATINHAGTYKCHMVPPDGRTVQACSLEVTGKHFLRILCVQITGLQSYMMQA